jgi:nucleoside phosphorylase
MTDLSPAMQQVLATLYDTIEPISGRRVAVLTCLSPTTANKALRALLDLGAVRTAPLGRGFYWQATSAADRLLGGQEGQRPERTVLVLTALPLEYVAVRDRVANGEELRAPNGVRYLKASISGLQVRWTAYVCEIGMGNTAAAALVGYAVEQFKTDFIMFTGIAAGLKPDDLEYGDVVIAERVYNAHSGKHGTGPDGEPTFLARPESQSTVYELVQLARHVARISGRPPIATRSDRFKITVASIASTEAVLADARSELYRRIRNGLNDCAAVDMESFGTYQAAYASHLPAVAVRGISDFVVGKDADSDSRWQPVAARHAADVAIDLLVHAHPDDIPRRKFDLAPTPDAASASFEGGSLPPHAQPWEARLRAVSARLADAACGELTSDNAVPFASWVSKALHRPPAWLRAETTGDGWALVGSLADGIGASTAPRAYARAAESACRNGDLALAIVHKIRSALSIRVPGAEAARIRAIRNALEEIDLSACPELRPLVDFHIATTSTANRAVLDAAMPALASLGHDPAVLGLIGIRSATSVSVSSATAQVIEVPLPEDVRSLLAGMVLLSISVVWLIDENGEMAQQAAESALSLIPDSSLARLRRSQALLTRLHSQGSASALEGTSDVLRRIEDDALAVRRARKEWGGDTSEALALAGRARIEAGDAEGALRLLLTAPKGEATAEEAKSAEVRQFAAMAALLTDRHDLALELAPTLASNVEAHLTRAAAFARSRGTRDEARDGYLRALELAGENPQHIERALLGLARLGSTIDSHSPGGLSPKLQLLRDHDPQAADLVLGTAALSSANYGKALQIARRYRSVLQAVELEADALMASGKAVEAVHLLDEFGRHRGDDSLRVQAMMLARQADLHEAVDRIADAVIGARDGELRRQAREAKAEAGGRRQRWDEVDRQARLLIDELDHSDPQRAAARAIAYRWIRAEALYHRRKFAIAFQALSQPTPLPVTRREQARLVLAVIGAFLSESPLDLPENAFNWLFSISADWVKDAQIGADALGLILMLPKQATDAQLMCARELLEEYFAVHKDNSRIKRIEFPPDPNDPDSFDPTPLVEQLKAQFEPQAETLSKLAIKLWLGHLPAAFIAEATNRSYAESLIKRVLGCYAIREELPSLAAAQVAARRVKAARDALQYERVVIDTSALVIGSKLDVARTHLTSLFGQVLFPASLRDDVYQARASLALHSDTTLGWDRVSGRPTITKFDADAVRRWADDADALQRDLVHLSVQPDAGEGEGERALWSAALLLAKETELPLWADDIALRAVAASEGIPAFGTLDLLKAADEESRIEMPSETALRAALTAARAVDLPLSKPWWVSAQDEDWDPNGYIALSVSRPAAWADQADSFAQYRDLIRIMVARSPKDTIIERIAGWANAAVNGIAWATPPGTRPRVVGALLAWTALNTEPMLNAATICASIHTTDDSDNGLMEELAGKILSALLAVAISTQRNAFPDGDGVRHVVVALADTIRTVADGMTTAAVVARALSTLNNDQLRAQATAAFLASPPAPSSTYP